MRYWLIIDNRQTGPLTVEEIAAGGYLRRDTPVWHEGLAGWVTAADVAEMAALLTPPAAPGVPSGFEAPLQTHEPCVPTDFNAQQRVPTAAETGEPVATCGDPASAGGFNAEPGVRTATGWVQAEPRRMPKEPESYLLWSILTTILCCLPVGIVAIVMSSRVSGRYVRGDYDGAVRASRAAELWIIVTIVAGLVAMPFQMAVAML